MISGIPISRSIIPKINICQEFGKTTRNVFLQELPQWIAKDSEPISGESYNTWRQAQVWLQRLLMARRPNVTLCYWYFYSNIT
jgi:hypothetical protein